MATKKAPLFPDPAASSPTDGLHIARVFSSEGCHPFDTVAWETRTAAIRNHRGEAIFEQADVAFPDAWSPLAVNVVASKYFYGDLARGNGSPAEGRREHTLKQLVHRVTRTISDWGYAQGYFASKEDAERFYDELTWLCVNQYGAFNSPVWFNVGLHHQYGVRDTGGKTISGWNRETRTVEDVDPYERPQASACFIISVEDSVDDIWKLMKESARLFKFGSGVGADWSSLRSSREKLSGGGTPSGPVSFMKVQDATGGTIKSGGKTRRAAIMQTLKSWHPDVLEFVRAKQEEEKKAWALIEEGYDGSFNGPAYGSVAFQNVNQSLRVDDAFMESAERDGPYALRAVTTGEVLETVHARDVLTTVSEGTHVCGDPGLQYEDTIQRWHTVPNTGPINSSNPCSEYMHLDNSACNLASLNLRKFQKADGSFDVARYRAAARVFITAQEILVDNAGYPSHAIARNSHDYRPLGLGFANLGALLMAMGLSYDSDEGRAVAAAVMAIEHCEGYARSAEIAANPRIGPFPGFEKNREPMLAVMRMHRDAVRDIHASCPAYLREAAQQSADQMVALGEQYGYRNAQATVLAPTGTIGFMMDCDTTGIEPDIALVKYKLLAGKGDGLMKIVNQTVGDALGRLGYTQAERAEILAYVDAHDTIEGAPYLKPEHLPVFDCAFRPANGERSIGHMGHVRMMAATQPFVSGAISKCVTADTLVLTEHGIVPIGAFYDGEAPDSFRRFRMRLASEGAPQEADLFYYGGVRPTVRLTLADGRTLEGTQNHRVRVATEGGYDWKALAHVTLDDHVAVRLGTEMWADDDAVLPFVPSPAYGSQKPIRLPERMTPALGRFLGWYTAEGNKNRSNWTVVVTNNDEALLERCRSTVRDVFGLEGRILTDPRNGVRSFVVASKTLVEFLDFVGCSGLSGTKVIPWAVLQSGREVVRAFVGGLYLDGYVRGKDGMVGLCLKSEALVRQLQVVLNNFGVRANLIRKHNRRYGRSFHELTVYGADVARFAALFTLDEPHKAARLAASAARGEGLRGSWSDIVPGVREGMQTVARAHHDTSRWRSLFDPRTQHVSRHTVAAFNEVYPAPDVTALLETGTHFVAVAAVEAGEAEVFDFQVPENHAFVGNGIVNHNTVNLPEHATVDDIYDAYVQGWKLGLKAIAIYRENSKRSQPLSTRRGGNTTGALKTAEPSGDGAALAEPEVIERVVEKVVYKPVRKRLPDERPSVTHKFSVAGHEGYLHVGLYADSGMPGEIFITMAKQGSTIAGLMDSFATAISLALQYGVPLDDLVSKFSHVRFEPAGFTNNRQIPIAKSITDYIFRYLSLRFLGREQEDPVAAPEEVPNPTDAVAGEAARHGAAADERQADLFLRESGDFNAGPSAPAPVPLVGQTVEHFMRMQEPRPASPEEGYPSAQPDATASFQNQEDAPACPNCGSITVRAGACYSCMNCGASTGCG